MKKTVKVKIKVLEKGNEKMLVLFNTFSYGKIHSYGGIYHEKRYHGGN